MIIIVKKTYKDSCDMIRFLLITIMYINLLLMICIYNAGYLY